VYGRGGLVVAWFKCCIAAENFPGQLLGDEMLFGFYTTRFIEATDAESAEANALQSLRAEIELDPPPGYKPTGQVYFEEVIEIAPDTVPARQPGMVWYRMGNAESTGGSG
jgi:hypothetical protein